MRRMSLCMSVLLAALVVGCKGREDQPAASAPAASQPVTAAAERPVVTSQPARQYQLSPGDLLEPAAAAEASPRSMWAAMQLALLEGSCEEAVAAYERVKSSFPQESGLLVAVGEQLVDALMSAQPPAIPQARAVLQDLEAWSSGAADNSAIKMSLDRWRLLADLMDGREKLTGDESTFSAWLADVSARLTKCDGQFARPELLEQAVDHLVGSGGEAQTSLADRIERVLVAMQLHVGWKLPEVLVGLEGRRVQLLLDSGRPADGLLEARLLLALSTRDSLSWSAAVDRVAEAMAAAGRDTAEVERFRAFQCFGPDGADGKSGTDDDLKDPLAS